MSGHRFADAGFGEKLAATGAQQIITFDMNRAPGPADAKAALDLSRLVKDAGPFDIAHGHSSKAGALVRLMPGLKIPRIYTPHAFRTLDPTLGTAGRFVYARVERFLGRTRTDALIAVSEEEAEHAIQDLGIPAEKVFYVANGIPDPEPVNRDQIRSELGLSPDDLCLGFVGRLAPQKAPERLIEALAILAPEFANLKVVMLGDGELEASTHQTAARENVADRLTVLGGRRGLDFMPAFDIYTMFSRFEGMPYVLIEALACGLPIVSTPVGGTARLVRHGHNGFIVDNTDDAKVLAQGLRPLIEDADLRQKFGAASKAMAKDYTAAIMTENTLKVYEAVIAQRS